VKQFAGAQLNGTLIEITNVFKSFKSPAGEVTVLKNVNLGFENGEFVCIVGKSGSGKSTLLNMITGIDHPTSGFVNINGNNLHQMREGALAVWRGTNMGVVFQFFQLLPMLTILENTLLPMDFCGNLPPLEREKRAWSLLKMVNLEAYADKLPASLSGGQQQTAAIARALANDPPILVADEPTGNLDSITAQAIFQIFTQMIERGKTIIMVTHDMKIARQAHRQVILSDGEIVNRTIALAFPDLTHPQMLQLTHLAQERTACAGEVILEGEENQMGLVIIYSGRAQLGCRESKDDMVLKILSENEYFSFLEKNNQGNVYLRAEGSANIKYLYLSRLDFERWLEKNPQSKEKMLLAQRQFA
jgi:putative ABC transport system ATP-binding protein